MADLVAEFLYVNPIDEVDYRVNHREISENIKQFLCVNTDGDEARDGSPLGYGTAFGYGNSYEYLRGDKESECGDGDGNGNGDRYGDGNGCRYDVCNCYGNGYTQLHDLGFDSFNGVKTYIIDGLLTMIDAVHGNYAKGRIIRTDFTIQDCFIAKVENRFFAHGETLRKAYDDAYIKAKKELPLEERFNIFISQYPDIKLVASNVDLFEWHGWLTGSCKLGRKTFADDHEIDLETGTMTIEEFINLTKDSYGSKEINLLRQRYNC